ncbi:guanylate kinase [Rhinocladiella mackenziei CBS 650.93]|uniref:Guanylate kinase n=1 Tax=Rhinocladiella mackenziei CBS 650.93 TaxID=1442369 RepID=A0A0D2G0U1_9EURO|nr:guanylate kinase [Rhinocladiella mackenziei CBS 650.93]KIX08127.1 guanylate kinase [Rhinocladiella mackenziei CBS 650.93]
MSTRLSLRLVESYPSQRLKLTHYHRVLYRKFGMAPAAPSTDKLRPIVFSGPSGTGKSTLITRLFAKHPDLFGFSVSHTTRKPRPGEQDGVHYHFTTPEVFEKMIAEDAFEEHAKFGGNYYGSSKKAVQDVAEGKGKSIDGTTAEGKRICIFDIEMEGVKQLKKSSLNPRICFIQPPSIEILEKRLRGRGDTSEDAIQKRLAQAKNEMEYCKTEGKNDKVIINDDLDATFKELDEWVMRDISSAN